MAKHNTCRILSIIFLFSFFNYVYSNELIDKINGIWVDSLKQNYILSIQNINKDLYYINYSDNKDNHDFDFKGVAQVYDNNRLYIKPSEEDYYYIYYDEEFNCVYVLWNHDYPSDELYDLPLKNVTKLFNEEYLIKKQEEEKNFLNKAVRSYLKNSKK